MLFVVKQMFCGLWSLLILLTMSSHSSKLEDVMILETGFKCRQNTFTSDNYNKTNFVYKYFIITKYIQYSVKDM